MPTLFSISRTLLLAAGLFQAACSASPEQSYLGAQPAAGSGAADPGAGSSTGATPSKVTLASYPSVSLKCGTEACVK